MSVTGRVFASSPIVYTDPSGGQDRGRNSFEVFGVRHPPRVFKGIRNHDERQRGGLQGL